MVSEGVPGSTPPPRTPLQEQAYQNMYRNQRTQVRVVDTKISRLQQYGALLTRKISPLQQYGNSAHDFIKASLRGFSSVFFHGRRSESINYRRSEVLNARKPQIDGQVLVYVGRKNCTTPRTAECSEGMWSVKSFTAVMVQRETPAG